MKRLWMVLLLLPTLATAQGLTSLTIQNLSLDYQNDSGNVSFDRTAISTGGMQVNMNDYSLDLQKENGSFKMQKDDTKLALHQITGGVLDKISNLQLASGSLNYQKGQALELAVRGARFDLGKGTQGIEALNLNCAKLESSGTPINHMMAPCFERGRIHIPKFKIAKASQRSVEEIFPIEEIKAELGNNTDGIIDLKNLKNIKVAIDSNHFNMSLYAKVLFRLKVKIKGLAYLYLGDKNDPASRDKVTFTIHKAKVGFISVKGLVLKALKKIKIQNLSVSGNRVTLTL